MDAEDWDQAERDQWPACAEAIAAVIAREPRDHWAAVFDGSDACVAPVLSMAEAAAHPHNAARATFLPGPPVQPAPGPRFSATPGAPGAVSRSDLDGVLGRWLA